MHNDIFLAANAPDVILLPPAVALSTRPHHIFEPSSCIRNQLVLVRACILSQILKLSRTGCQVTRLPTQSIIIRASTRCPTLLSCKGSLFPYVAPSSCDWHRAWCARLSSDSLRVHFAEPVSSSAPFGSARNDRLSSRASAPLSPSGSILSTAASRQLCAADPDAIVSSTTGQRRNCCPESTGPTPAHRDSLQILQKTQGMHRPCPFSQSQHH